MANLSIVIVPAKKLSNGRHRVRIAVAHRSQTRYISTQFILDSANQMKNGRVVKHENAANINACLRKLINEYEEILSSIHYQSNISCTELIHVITREQQKKGITFNTVVKEYLSMMEADDRKKSHKLYNIACAKFLKHMKGDFPLVQLSPTHIQSFADVMKAEGLKETSIRIYLTLIKVILNYARKMNYVTYLVHPFVLFKMPVSNIRELDLSVDELKKIRDRFKLLKCNSLEIFIHDFEKLLALEKIKMYQGGLKPMTIDELESELKLSMQDSLNDNVFSNDELLKNIADW